MSESLLAGAECKRLRGSESSGPMCSCRHGSCALDIQSGRVAGAEDIPAARDECAKLIDAHIAPLLESGSLPPMWPWWLPLVDAIAERLTEKAS